MPDTSILEFPCCSEPLERLRYFSRQLLTADDLRVEQEFFREKMRRHNRFLHGWGIVCGCVIEPIANAKDWQVRVCPGYAVSPQGDEILIDDCVVVDLKAGAPEQPCSVRWPCPPVGEMPGGDEDSRTVTVYLAVRYAECFSRPVKMHPAGCGCDETGCEYSRVRDSFEIKVLWNLPQSHVDAQKDDKNWCALVKKLPADLRRKHMFPVPSCPECASDPWVVLATLTVPKTNAATGASQKIQISYADRRVLLATQRLQTALLCLP